MAPWLSKARWWVGGILLLQLAACSIGTRRFPMREVVWKDNDQTPIAKKPNSFYSPYMWDGADQAVFRPVAKVWLANPKVAAINVNAVDEVADSSWFTNRLTRRLMTPKELAQGACDDLNDDLPTPWTVIGGKPDGSNPGFIIKDGTGRKYLMKTDGHNQSERPTGSDVVGASIYHAAGYFAPCNRVVEVTLDKLVLSPKAKIKLTNGTKERMTQEHVKKVLEKATHLGPGRYRASVSQFIDGIPISPWIYEGTWDEDPNDVVPHEHRREVRGMYVLAAWLDHIDSRQENTMAAWMKTGKDAGYVRHYMIDFGDTLGILFVWDDLSKRFGHSGYFDLHHMFLDFISAGLIDRPWFHAKIGKAGKELGYFDSRRFVADEWIPGYPNPAFLERTEADMAWMARIIARITDKHIVEVSKRARFTKPIIEEELIRILGERREKILERFLTRLSPLTWPEIRNQGGKQEICLQDLAVWTKIRKEQQRSYRVTSYMGEGYGQTAEVAGLRQVEDSYVCVPLQDLPGASAENPQYQVLDIVASSKDKETTYPARVHLYSLGNNQFKFAGLERPESAEAPRQ